MIRAKIFNNEVVGLTPQDQRALDEIFPDGEVRLNSDNCPEVAAAIDKISADILAERKNLFGRLARFD